jgi:hypothetical protein
MRGMPTNADDQMADVYRRVAELERRIQNQKRTGRVLKVDAAKGIIVELDQDPVTGKRDSTDWIPWQEPAMGGTKSHFPPSVGEQVDITSETGDGHDWRATLSTPSDANQRPYDKLDANGFWRGQFRLQFWDDKCEIAVGNTVLRLTPDGAVLIAKTFEQQGDETFLNVERVFIRERIRNMVGTVAGWSKYLFAKV